MPYYLPHSDKRFRNAIENMIHVFCVKKKGLSKLLLNRLHLAKNSTRVMTVVCTAFQRYIESLIWKMLGEVQPVTKGSSGRITQAVKLQQTQVHHAPRANPTTSKIPI